MEIPGYVNKALEILRQEEGTPYVVGGAVRDLLLGRTPHDWDVASDLPPEAVMDALRAHNIPVVDKLGNNFGVVVGVFGGHPVEIATFRGESYGEDAHRPEKVYFSQSIDDDLARRDFTINAMAMDSNGYIIDPYGGKKDIMHQWVRPVGDPRKRYQEDALRMYRACRFVSQLGFSYAEGVEPSSVFVYEDFWKDTKAKDLSVERVRNELEKLLLGKFPDKGLSLMMDSRLVNAPCSISKNGNKTLVYPLGGVYHLKGLEQNPAYHRFDVWGHTLSVVKEVPPELKLRYAALFHDTGKGMARTYTDGVPHDIGHEKYSEAVVEQSLGPLYKKAFVNDVKWIVRNHMAFMRLLKAKDRQVKHWVRILGRDFRNQDELVSSLADLKEMFCADLKASRNNQEDIKAISDCMDKAIGFAKTNMALHSKDLDIDGNYIKKISEENGLEIKEVYNGLIRKVQDGVVRNEKDELVKSLEKQIIRSKGNLR